ncbi:hypothetical protein HLH33_13065 [Gluconacetobacter diazotrophicus]|uniref:Uncharacterized protein n=1 Tax=Gluconacetobacter diazotrophicus TaxID=33996 RepID=A0A7W4NMV5_GLUDI|nr:hypothetical protein [Gluconacetobacter diazotrophicus]MBB2157230.1 hypothetical protein [Gluconacetobacter diazotrophicus]
MKAPPPPPTRHEAPKPLEGVRGLMRGDLALFALGVFYGAAVTALAVCFIGLVCCGGGA